MSEAKKEKEYVCIDRNGKLRPVVKLGGAEYKMVVTIGRSILVATAVMLMIYITWKLMTNLILLIGLPTLYFLVFTSVFVLRPMNAAEKATIRERTPEDWQRKNTQAQ